MKIKPDFFIYLYPYSIAITAMFDLLEKSFFYI